MNAKQQKQETLKPRQQEIIEYLLRFRYLTTPQLQTLLHHKSKDYVLEWLNDLAEKQYIFRFYTKEFAGKPSEFCLHKGSIRYLRSKGIPARILRRIYDEKTRSQTFRRHTIFLATVYLSLVTLVEKTEATLSFYTKDDLHGIKYLPLPNPDTYFAITEKNTTVKRYFLDIFDDGSFIKKRIYQYFYYYKRKYWQSNAQKPFPEIILICPTEQLQKRISTFIQKKLSSDTPVFYLANMDTLQRLGMCREVLQKVT